MATGKNSQRLRFAAFILALFLLWYLSRFFKVDISSLQDYLSGYPLILSGALYILLYVIVTFFILFSKDLFWLMGALLFGPFLSASLICIAELVNAVILFYFSRFLGRGYVERKMSVKYRALDEKLSRLSLPWLIVFRAAPLVPYRFMDLAAGLTGMRFKKYFIAVFLGTPLKMFWIQYIIYAVGRSILNNPAALTEYFLSNKPLFFFSLFYVILVIAVLIKIARRD